jgi:hypothetical protein
MKKIYLFVLLLLSITAANRAYAGWPIGKYRNVVIPSFNYYTSKDTWTSTGQKITGAPGTGFTSYSFGLYAGYGITRRLDAIVNLLVPFQNSAYKSSTGEIIKQSSSGVGDLQAGLAYNLVNFGYKSFLSVQVSGIIPLYDTTKTVALGYAAYGAETDLMYSGSIDAGFLKHTYFNTMVGFRRYFDNQGLMCLSTPRRWASRWVAATKLVLKWADKTPAVLTKLLTPTWPLTAIFRSPKALSITGIPLPAVSRCSPPRFIRL